MASWRKGRNPKRKGNGGSDDSSARSTRRPASDAARQRLVAHPLFAPGMGLWGALLGAMLVAVVPYAYLRTLIEGTMLATLGLPMKPLLAAGFAGLFGLLAFVLAASRSAAARRRLNPNAILNAVARKVNPIDPARDLGTASIDDPIETMPFASPAWRDTDDDGFADDVQEAQPEPPVTARFDPVRGADRAAGFAPTAFRDDAPVELDLAGFAELPGRNAVWVEAPAPAPAPAAAVSGASVAASLAQPAATPHVAAVPQPPSPPAPLRRAVLPPVPGAAALARLRAVPAEQLSMAQMVERLAGALHDHRANAPRRMLNAAELAAREAALAEAIKALAAVSDDSPAAGAADREAPLRAALARLQPRRGAA